jgi:hypothetical protein
MEVSMKCTLQFLLSTLLLVALCSIMMAPALSAATITSTGTGGNWNATATWVGGVVPGAADDVVIANGATVAINADVAIASLTVGQGVSGMLTFDFAAVRKVTVTGNITVAAGGTFTAQTPISTTGDLGALSTSITNVASTANIVNGMNIGTTTGIAAGTTVASFTANTITLSLASTNAMAIVGAVLNIGYDDTLAIGGNLTNNGTFDMSRGISAGICHVIFNKAGDQTISGTGTPTRFRSITLDKTAVANKVIASINVTAAGTPLTFLAGTWEQTAGRFTGTSGTINAGSATATGCALNIIGSGSASIFSNLNIFGTLLVNTTDSLIVGSGASKIDLTNISGAVATFTRGTVVVYGKMSTAAVTNTTINGANIIIDPRGFTTTDYAFRSTTGTAINPFTFTSGTITILNPNPTAGASPELAASSSVVPNISGTASFILGQGAGTVASAAGYRINLNNVCALNDLTINTGSVGVALQTNVTIKGTLTVKSSGTLSGSFFWKASRYVYNGSVAQVTGSIMPDTVKCVTINNPLGVTASKALTITDTLFLVSGTLSGPYTAGTTVSGGTGVREVGMGMPREFPVVRNYPNPFNPSTQIQFSVVRDGYAALTIYDMIGREVAVLFGGKVEGGVMYETEFNASNMPSGIYIARLQSAGQMATQKLVLMK